jgi:hypothetical protein
METIGGDRRSDRRYGMQLQLRWKLVRRRREIDAGTGRTIDMSSGGVLFETGSELPTGLNVEIHIAWPMLLHDVAPLQLVVMGRIVRSSRGWAAIRTISHEFRTAGTPANQRQTLPNSSRSGMLIQMHNVTATSGGR